MNIERLVQISSTTYVVANPNEMAVFTASKKVFAIDRKAGTIQMNTNIQKYATSIALVSHILLTPKTELMEALRGQSKNIQSATFGTLAVSLFTE